MMIKKATTETPRKMKPLRRSLGLVWVGCSALATIAECTQSEQTLAQRGLGVRRYDDSSP